jgi:hypothetical protein
MPIMHDGAGEGTALLISAQVAAIEAELAAERGQAVIDLSSTAPGQAPRRARKGRRRGPGSRTLPILLATPGPSGRTLEAWCPPCRKFHVHGRHGAIEDCGPGCGCGLHLDLHRFRGPCTCPPGSGDGSRTAHCSPGGPFKERGYFIEEVAP